MNAFERMEPRRFLSAGEIDTTFGTNGSVSLEFAGDQETVMQILHAPGGKLLAFGRADSTGVLCIARFNADGTLDSTFGSAGKVTTSIFAPTIDEPASAAIDPNSGKFAVVYGNAATGDPAGVAMFTANGTLDNSFSADGRIQSDNAFLLFKRVGFQSDGRLIVIGTGYDANGIPPQPDYSAYPDPVLIRRYNLNGAQDTGFGTGTQAARGTTALEHAHDVQDIKLLSDGRIVIVTNFDEQLTPEDDGDARGQELYRLTANGALDTTFGSGGVVEYAEVDQSTTSLPLDMEIDDDGSIVVLSTEGTLNLVMRKFSSNGTPVDGFTSAFDRQGRFARRVGIADNGQIFLSDNGSVTRYDSLGRADYSYGFNGIATVPRGFTALVNGDGKVLVGGATMGDINDPGDWQITRLQTGAGGPRRPTLNRRGTLVYQTTQEDDTISVSYRGRDNKIIARLGDFAQSFAPSKVKRIVIYALAGDDTITIAPGVLRAAYVEGGDGNDTINGGVSDDVLLGGAGKDKVYGNDGNDKCLGGLGDDFLLGGAGKDDLFGDAGVDILNGAGGNDRLFGGVGEVDNCNGGSGTDSAQDNDEDNYSQIESMIA